MATFETIDLAQMRRCRGAQLHGGTVREAFQIAGERVPTAGYVHAIRPDFTSSPLRWTIVIEAEKTALRPKNEIENTVGADQSTVSALQL